MKEQLADILLDQIDLGVMVLDLATRFRLWNEWLFQRTGIPCGRVQDRLVSEVFSDLPPWTVKSVEGVLQSGLPRILSPVIHPWYFPLRDPMRQLVRLIPLTEERGAPAGLVVLIEDVTAQLEYEETLEERFRLMQEGVKDYAMVILDDQGRITHWDRGAERLLMYQAPQIISRKISFFYASADQKQDQADLHLAVAFKTGRWEGEIPLQRKDGSTFWAELVLSVLKDQRERVRGFSLMIRDLTEQQEAKRALWDSLTQRKALEKEREKTLEQMRQTLIGTVQVISRTVEMRDPYTAGHQQRVAVLAEAIAREMRLGDEQREAVHMAGTIHDLGKISIPAEILVKPSRLPLWSTN